MWRFLCPENVNSLFLNVVHFLHLTPSHVVNPVDLSEVFGNAGVKHLL